MSQLSLFSAEQTEPSPRDLAGLLATTGQIVQLGGAARVSAVVPDQWRADALAVMIEEAGLRAQLDLSEEGNPLVRTLAAPELQPMALAWTRGAVKTAPSTWVPGPRALRAWALAGGEVDGVHYLLSLDPHAPESAPVLATALMRAGVAPTLVGTRGAKPALRVSGHRRLLRLRESIGDPPAGTDAAAQWPQP
ncbi:hypothetical protein TPB0596_42420 [Tsukamurella pulmonis]|uniref:hypothetical protein n=1 Tax=Tsukamurella pulmonis TaxID=47312 RepID=UPI001EDDD1FB|nr:hypothetical protein [Tsukamurella pulmonis]BDD84479.1 hypothetical protein TPB0596_42420 [Tsukamurella pulmonis]